MKTLTVELELLDETVVSERNATEGGHRSLDYLPGATLLGHAASRLYASLGPEAAWLVFHSGKVRFGNGLPLAPSGTLARPMPLCWHEDKAGKRAVQNNRIDPVRLNDLLTDTPNETIQPRQLRTGYVCETGEVVRPGKYLRMKTAIDAEEGRAARSQLFGYEAIAVGTRFRAEIHVNDLANNLLDQLKATFNSTLRIGRSRSAQYGRVQASTGSWMEATRPSNGFTGEIRLWLQSDLALANPAGAPTLIPTPESLGLPSGTRYQADRSFLRFRRYTPYNRARSSYDVERQVITQGSVLAYELPNGRTFHPVCIQCGLGLYREAGLGQALVNPALLEGKEALAKIFSQTQAQCGSTPRQSQDNAIPNDPLAHWLVTQGKALDTRKQAQVWAEARIRDLEQRYGQARRYLGLTADQLAGPGRSQWGRIEETAKAAQDLRQTLFYGKNAVCKENDEDWSLRYGPEDHDTYESWLCCCVNEVEAHSDARYRLALLADLARKLVIRLELGDRA
jgi:hypothetical protein